jgi:hypothetical protein
VKFLILPEKLYFQVFFLPRKVPVFFGYGATCIFKNKMHRTAIPGMKFDLYGFITLF